MQQSFAFPLAFKSQAFCATEGQYVMIPGVHYPFYFVGFTNLANYQIHSQNIGFNIPPYLQNTFSEVPAFLATPSPACNKIQFNVSVQNGKQHSQPIPQIPKKKLCVKKQICLASEQDVKNDTQKRGNERFIKKNTQSNIINQIFSFLWTPQKSKPFLIKILKSQEKIDLFYQLMRTIKTQCKSQLNRFYLKTLIENSEWENGLKKLRKKIKKFACMLPEQLCVIVRKLVYHYLREISFLSIMTSKKMNHQLWKLHLEKCKEVINFLFQQMAQ